MFCDELGYRPFYLMQARSVVLTSFLTHKTISHLDLQISHQVRCRTMTDELHRLDKSFFCTIESFQNNLVPQRRLLHCLNLDVSKGREYNYLRDAWVPRDNKSLFVKIEDNDDLLKHALAWLLQPALEKADCKIKILKWMVSFRPLKSYLIYQEVQYSCATVLYHECGDSEFVKKCLEKLIGLQEFSRTGEIEVMDYLLYHARLCDFDVRESYPWSLTDIFIKCHRFRFVSSALKYEATVYYSERISKVYERSLIFEIRQRYGEEETSYANQLRRYRILQILYSFRYHEFPGASEALCLVWRSIPDCFVSLQEMKDVYGKWLPDEFISRAHNFYEKAIGEIVPCREPRRLSHYCRSVIRKSLYDSKQWLPDGIKKLELPTRLKSFLSLEIDNLRPENFQGS